MTEHAISKLTQEMTKALAAVGRDFSAHSIFSPSGSHMWAYCSGSLIPNLFKSDTAGEDAAYGTVGHSVGETWLLSGERPDHLLGTVHTISEGETEFQITVDQAMMDYVEQYVSWCIYEPGNHFVETRVDFSDLTPLKKQTGTADHAVCRPGLLIVTDLKMGKGIQVFAKENTQAILYAYGFFRKYDDLFDFQKIVIRIAQPRLGHFDVWEITREELLQWAKWLKARAFMAWCKDAIRTPGEKQCKFCKIKSDCAAFAVFMERLTDGVFENLDAAVDASEMDEIRTLIDEDKLDLTPIGVGSLTTEQKAKILPFRSMIESWFADIFNDLESRCSRGELVPGYKMAEGRSNRKFKDEDKACEHLEFLGLDYDVIRPRGFIGIGAAEDELRKAGYRRKDLEKLLGSVVVKPAGKPSMVPESDSRPSLESAMDSVFVNFDDEL